MFVVRNTFVTRTSDAAIRSCSAEATVVMGSSGSDGGSVGGTGAGKNETFALRPRPLYEFISACQVTVRKVEDDLMEGGS
jgi:hypothetical protein